MKKNTMMRFASVLLVAVLLTTCVISGTFAKYTTGGEGTEKARVAKWGVVVDVATDLGLFAESYDVEDDPDFTVVSSEASVNVVAPGTGGALTDISISGIPEVAVEIIYTAELTLTGWEIGGVEYCPIVITVNGTPYKVGDDGIADVDALETKIAEVVSNYSEEYDPNTNLDDIAGDSTNVEAADLAISWAWAFNGDDVKDTALGDLAATGNAPEIQIDVTVTVNQVGD